ncbi:Cytochrome P [Parasponia andersonii]|uniref:Cytochrome P n=1 Tax=Parasponia andersonii TaxID=3476 RepID=A0A2P5BRU2_PARAD|nr:Cytochrome P [Parasponia andersonii]
MLLYFLGWNEKLKETNLWTFSNKWWKESGRFLLTFPFTRYRRGLQASKKAQNMVNQLIYEKRVESEQKCNGSPHQDLITCLLSIRNDNNEEMITDKEIVQNVLLVMAAGYDSSSVFVTFLVRFLSNEPAIYEAVLRDKHNSFLM